MAGEGTTSCPECHKRYPWRDSLEGKKVKCKCGHVFEAALDLEAPQGDHDDRTYDVAEDYVAPMESAPTVPRPAVASVADAYPQRKPGKVLTYAHATPAEAAELRERSMLREWYLPIGLIVVGFVFWIAQVAIERASGGGAGTGGLVGSAFMMVVVEIVLIALGVAVSAKFMSIDFGPIPELVLKVVATGVLGAAVGTLTWTIFPKDDMHGIIIALHVVIIMYWVLFYTFFEMDLQECLMTVAIITAFHIGAVCILFKPIA